jgi:hypothetical protein
MVRIQIFNRVFVENKYFFKSIYNLLLAKNKRTKIMKNNINSN